MFDVCFNSWQASDCTEAVGYLWRMMGWLGRGDIALLTLMLVNTLIVVCRGLYRHGAARRQSRAFVHDSAAALRDGRLDQVISIAARHRRSHVATVVAAGLTAFLRLRPNSLTMKPSLPPSAPFGAAARCPPRN